MSMRGMPANLADALTVARLIAAPLFVLCAVRSSDSFIAGWTAGLLFAVAAWSDVVDGRLARRRGTASERGRILDHFADIVFLLSALGTYAYLGIAPWWVPGSIAASFSFYVADSWIRTAPVRPTLIGSRIGHVGGVANYVLIGVLVFNESAGLHWLPAPVVSALFLLVPIYSGASVVARLVARPAPILSAADNA